WRSGRRTPGYLPVCRATDPICPIVSIPVNEGHVFKTKQRAPTLITCEVMVPRGSPGAGATDRGPGAAAARANEDTAGMVSPTSSAWQCPAHAVGSGQRKGQGELPHLTASLVMGEDTLSGAEGGGVEVA
ncbi:unnamed protein product, partial [Discosporangium mesarthrocarpum]